MKHLGRKLFLVVLIAIYSNPLMSRAQDRTIGSSQTFDNATIEGMYEFFFIHLETIDAMYAKAIVENRDTSKWRNYDQIRSGLTDDQWAILRAVAAESRKNTKSQDDKIAEGMKQMAEARRTRAGDQHPASFDGLIEARKEMIRSAILKFRTTAGEAAYQNLTNYFSFTMVAQPHQPTSVPPGPDSVTSSGVSGTNSQGAPK